MVQERNDVESMFRDFTKKSVLLKIDMTKKILYINILLSALLFIAVWAFWRFGYPCHLHFQEQLQLFEFTKQYFADTIIKPAGLAEYLSRFLVQFFYNGNLGPVIVAIVFALIFNAMALLFSKSEKETKLRPASVVMKYSLALIPVIFLLGFLVGLDAKFTLPVAMCITLYAVWTTEKVTSLRVFLPLAIVGSVVLAFTVGSVFVVYTMLVFGRLAVRKAMAKEWKWALGFVLLAFLLWGLVILLLHVCYPYPTGLLTWGDYYNRFAFIKAYYNNLTWWVTILVGLLIADVRNHWCEYATPVLTIACGFYVHGSYDPDEESLLENIYLVRMNHWDDIIEKYKTHTPASSYELTGLNLALAMKGQLADTYFNYPQQGTDGLLPVYQMDYMTPLLSAEAYYQMGMINTAQRFFYESMESIADQQKSAYCLKRLTVTALINGRINLAKGYLHKLSNTLYYSDWAKSMRQYVDNPKLIDSNPELARMRSIRTKNDLFFDDQNQPPFIADMLNGNPENRVAWQYLFTMLMVEGRLDELMQTAAFYTKQFPSEFLPTHVQEALLYQWVARNNTLNGFPWKVRAQVGQRFLQFAKEANQPRDIAEPIVRRDYADTFWCYAVFKAQEVQKQPSPDGTTGASQLQ